MNCRSYLIASTTIVLAVTLPALADSDCYMTTSSGQKIELKGMCGNSSAKSKPARSSRSQPATHSTRQTASSNEFLVQEGRGGYENSQTGIGADYQYQVWTNSMNTYYTLKVWRLENYPNGSLLASHSFRSGREALDYFDCNYAKKRISTCPR